MKKVLEVCKHCALAKGNAGKAEPKFFAPSQTTDNFRGCRTAKI